MKTCTKCKEEKPFTSFTKGKGSDGLSYWCKSCKKREQKSWREKNKEKIKQYNKEYIEKNYAKKKKDKKKTVKNKKPFDEKEYRKQYYLKNKEKIKQQSKQNYYKTKQKNPEKIKEKNRRSQRAWQRKNAFKYRAIKLITQSFIRKGFYYELNWDNIENDILGCSFDFLKDYLNNTFIENYGINIEDALEKIHIDHIVPLSSANNIEDVIKLNHYTNLQYLYRSDNLLKSDRENEKFHISKRIFENKLLSTYKDAIKQIEKLAIDEKNENIIDIINKIEENNPNKYLLE
jgi:hypothetical protein